MDKMETPPAGSTDQQVNPIPLTLKRLLDPAHPLCREDMIWTLDYIKRKVAEGAPEWTGLDRPRLLAHFATYAGLAMQLLHRQSLCGEDAEHLRALLRDTLP
jgi:hypothetical protein